MIDCLPTANNKRATTYCLKCVPAFRTEVEFGPNAAVLVFVERRNSENPEKSLAEQGGNQQQTLPTYTYFKKRRGERRMAVVERKLHDRKELWFPYLQKNNEFFANTMATKTPQICIFDNGKHYFCTLCTCIFHLLTF